MARSLELQNIVSQPEAFRNDEWEKALFESFADARVEIESETPKTGPDGWPYLLVRTSTHATEPTVKVIDWLSERGIGLALNAHKNAPDYVFTYGMLWNFRVRGEFITASTNLKSGPVEISKDQQLWVGTPSESTLPTYVRNILREFFKQQGQNQVRIAMVSADQKQYDLCFSLESLGEPSTLEHRGLLEAISWFMPSHYALALLSEKQISGFTDL